MAQCVQVRCCLIQFMLFEACPKMSCKEVDSQYMLDSLKLLNPSTVHFVTLRAGEIKRNMQSITFHETRLQC